MSAPYDTCECCGTLYFYVDSGSWSSDGREESRTWTKGLCAGCGGHYVHYPEAPSDD